MRARKIILAYYLLFFLKSCTHGEEFWAPHKRFVVFTVTMNNLMISYTKIFHFKHILDFICFNAIFMITMFLEKKTIIKK